MTHLKKFSVKKQRPTWISSLIFSIILLQSLLFQPWMVAGWAMEVHSARNCSNESTGFAKWITQIQKDFARQGIGTKALTALGNTRYASATIAADRNQKSFKLNLQQFMQKRGASVIVSQGRALKKQNKTLFATIESQYGVPAGPLLAIWGMETNFGRSMGNQNILSAIATLSYDCRRAAFFRQQLFALLQLIDQDNLSPAASGAMHGEIGQTQFLPLNVIRYGVDADHDGQIDLIHSKEDALTSTANFLSHHGWKRNISYQSGEHNFTAIQGWNQSSVYQQAIAIIAQQIDMHPTR